MSTGSHSTRMIACVSAQRFKKAARCTFARQAITAAAMFEATSQGTATLSTQSAAPVSEPGAARSSRLARDADQPPERQEDQHSDQRVGARLLAVLHIEGRQR